MNLVCIRDYEEQAKQSLSFNHLHYFKDGDGAMTTVALNRESYQKLRLRPKCLRDVSKVNMTNSVLGSPMSMPVGVCPSAFQRIAHPDGELATARAAEKAGVVFIQSTMSGYSIEEVAEAAPNAEKWLQLYYYEVRSVTEKLVRSAEKCGYKAIVLTVDSPQYGKSYEMKRTGVIVPPGIVMRNLFGTGEPEPAHPGAFDKTLTWDEGVKWLVNFTKLPVVAKGILRGDEALKAVEVGCQGVIVSNHGGRNLDTTPATIEILPEIVEAIGGRIPIMIDGGVTLGTDVFKALALGADMVLMGRPIIWALAVNGQKGVEHIFELLRNELQVVMQLCGTTSLEEITSDFVASPKYFVEQLRKYQKGEWEKKHVKKLTNGFKKL